MRIGQAQHIADFLVGELIESSERIAIAGSVRRVVPEVKDVELVLIPRMVPVPVMGQMAMLGPSDGVVPPNQQLLPAPLEVLQRLEDEGRVVAIKAGTHDVERRPGGLDPEGRYWRLWVPAAEVKIDIFVLTAERWGLGLLVRTGPADFGKAVLARWRVVAGLREDQKASIELRLHNRFGGVVDTLEEEDVFAACKLLYVAPEFRQGAADVARAAMPLLSVVDGNAP